MKPVSRDDRKRTRFHDQHPGNAPSPSLAGRSRFQYFLSAPVVAENQPEAEFSIKTAMPADSLPSFALRLAEQLRRGGDAFWEESRFAQAARELFTLQVEQNSVLRSWCQARGVRPNPDLVWRDIPAIPTNAFKEADVSCIPVPERTAEFHSSGTTTQNPSRHFHRPESLDLYATSVRAAFARRLGPASGTLRLISLTPSPKEAPHSSLVHMFQILGEHSACGRTTYFGEVTPSGWSVDDLRLEEFLRTQTGPILLGGTAFNYVNWLDHRPGPPIRLPAGSVILETGGYKGRSRELPRPELIQLLTENLGVPEASILTEYGMSELSSQAYSVETAAAEGVPKLRFPPWVRTRVISPETGQIGRAHV